MTAGAVEAPTLQRASTRPRRRGCMQMTDGASSAPSGSTDIGASLAPDQGSLRPADSRRPTLLVGLNLALDELDPRRRGAGQGDGRPSPPAEAAAAWAAPLSVTARSARSSSRARNTLRR